MLRLFRKVWVVSAVALVVSLLLGPISATALTTKEKYKPFEDCLKSETASSWLVLMDTSQSLQKPNVDPEDDRVRVLEDLLTQITPKPDSGKEVYLEIWEFGETVRRAKGLQGEDWQSLDNTSLRKFLDVVKGLTNAENDFHTDYLRALRPANPYNRDRNEIASERGVIEVFERQKRPTCQVLVWFSDGELSLEKGYVSHGLARTFEAGDAEYYDDLKANDLDKVLGRNEADLIQELCRRNGPVDQLRGRGRAGLKTGEATYVITVGLGEGDRFGVLQAISEGETSTEMTTDHKGDLEGLATCGQKPGLGIFRPAENVGDLDFVFFGISAGTETELCAGEGGGVECGKRVTFQISPAMSYFSILLGRSGPMVEVNLEGPNGTYSLDGAEQNYEVEDGTLNVKAPRERSIRASVTSPTAGEWAVLFDVEHPENKVHFLAEGQLKPRLVSKFTEEGKSPVLSFELAKEDVAESLTKLELEDEHLDLDLDVQVRSADSDWIDLVEDGEPSKGGVLRYRGDRPLESDDDLECRARLEAEYQYSPNVAPLELGIAEWGPCEGVGLGADGKIKVDERATFPTECDPGQSVPLDGFFDAAVSQNVLKHELCFRAGLQGAGEVCFEKSEQQTQLDVKVKVLTRPPCLTLKNGEEGIFAVEFSADRRDLESHFKLNGEDEAFVRLQVEFRSRNSDGGSGSYRVPYEATIKHSTTTERDWLKILFYILVSLLLPFLLLYAYNYFWGSRFTKTGPLQRADVDVVVRNGQLFPAQGRNSIVNSEDFGPHAGVRSRSRKFQVTGEVGQVAELAGRMPKLPHNEPWAEGRLQDGVRRYVLSEQGTSKDLTAGRLTPSAAPAWLLGISEADSETSRLSEDWHGRLLVVLPSEPGKPAEASFEELLPQINKAIDEHNEAVQEWQNSRNVASEESVLDESSGADLISPPETQLPEMPADEFPKPNNFPEIPD